MSEITQFQQCIGECQEKLIPKLCITVKLYFYYSNTFIFCSFEMVSDGKYHTVELLAIKKNFTLRVDRGLARSIINEGTQEYLRLSTPLYVGGVPPEPGQNAFTQWHLRNVTSFNGIYLRHAYPQFL